MSFLKKIDARLAALNTKVTSALGGIIFVPACTLLAQQDKATLAIQTIAPHFPPILTEVLSAQLVALAGYLLYQGKPHNAS